MTNSLFFLQSPSFPYLKDLQKGDILQLFEVKDSWESFFFFFGGHSIQLGILINLLKCKVHSRSPIYTTPDLKSK